MKAKRWSGKTKVFPNRLTGLAVLFASLAPFSEATPPIAFRWFCYVRELRMWSNSRFSWSVDTARPVLAFGEGVYGRKFG